MAKYLTLLLIFLVACAGTPAPVTFEEVRIHRWTALRGGEIFILRRVGAEWSAELLGDGARIFCFYQKNVRPRSDWNALWNTLLAEGLLELSGAERQVNIEDGDGFVVETRIGNETRRYSVDHPRRLGSENSKRILRIGNLISREFDTPVFEAEYESGRVSEYLYSPCQAR